MYDDANTTAGNLTQANEDDLDIDAKQYYRDIDRAHRQQLLERADLLIQHWRRRAANDADHAFIDEQISDMDEFVANHRATLEDLLAEESLVNMDIDVPSKKRALVEIKPKTREELNRGLVVHDIDPDL
jgi:hypothetical protein